jgi:hypothetical protein
MPTWPQPPNEPPQVNCVLICLTALSLAERRDLANSLLRAAWCASLEHTRVVLLDALVEADRSALGETL